MQSFFSGCAKCCDNFKAGRWIPQNGGMININPGMCGHAPVNLPAHPYAKTGCYAAACQHALRRNGAGKTDHING
jgi:hypothetical protein